MVATSSNRLIVIVEVGDLHFGSIVWKDAETAPGSCGDPGAALGVCGADDGVISEGPPSSGVFGTGVFGEGCGDCGSYKYCTSFPEPAPQMQDESQEHMPDVW